MEGRGSKLDKKDEEYGLGLNQRMIIIVKEEMLYHEII